MSARSSGLHVNGNLVALALVGTPHIGWGPWRELSRAGVWTFRQLVLALGRLRNLHNPRQGSIWSLQVRIIHEHLPPPPPPSRPPVHNRPTTLASQVVQRTAKQRGRGMLRQSGMHCSSWDVHLASILDEDQRLSHELVPKDMAVKDPRSGIVSLFQVVTTYRKHGVLS